MQGVAPPDREYLSSLSTAADRAPGTTSREDCQRTSRRARRDRRRASYTPTTASWSAPGVPPPTGRSTNNNHFGIRVADGVVSGNVVYSNGVGIDGGGNSTYSGNLVYGNTTAGIWLQPHSRLSSVRLFWRTTLQPPANGAVPTSAPLRIPARNASLGPFRLHIVEE